jgi:small subunit ribosomal protein S21
MPENCACVWGGSIPKELPQTKRNHSAKQIFFMIIIDIKEGETIDRALKRYKRKHRDVGLVRELRRRKQFTKPSIKRRNEMLKARYKEEKDRTSEQ